MGRHVLRLSRASALVAGVLLAACTPAEDELALMDTALMDGPAHATLVCADCHVGDLPGSRDLAVASREGCMASGCHEEGGPFRVELSRGTVTFDHRDHPAPWAGDLECGSCHGHPAGGVPLEASTDGCALCHAESLQGDDPVACRSCHQEAPPAAFTSQGIQVPHSGTTWLETGCVRCHYEVVDQESSAPTGECSSCHSSEPREGPGAVAAVLGGPVANGRGALSGDDADIHPDHADLSCSTCHADTRHEISGISTAVQLQCAECHAVSHDLPVADLPANGTCAECHREDHREQQRLFLGLLDGATPTPSVKFLAGMTCASCHGGEHSTEALGALGSRASGTPGVSTTDAGRAAASRSLSAGLSGAGARGSAERCVLCHTEEYETVLDWWVAGGAQRLAVVERFVAEGRRRLGSVQAASGRLARAEADLTLVRVGGAQHSVEIADRVMRAAMRSIVEAYEVAEVTAPSLPDLGPRPRAGFCSYCHYELDGDSDLDEMPDDFHREVMGR